MYDIIKEVASIIQEDETLTRILLTHAHWDEQALLERFYNGDKRKLFKDANIMELTLRKRSDSSVVSGEEFCDSVQDFSPESPDLGEPGEPAQPIADDPKHKMISDGNQTSSPIKECGVCMTSVKIPEETLNLMCGHTFCLECWREYVTHRILNEGIAQNISCAAYGCKVLASDRQVLNLITDSNVRDKYFRLISNSFVSCSKLLRWCPSASCTKAIKAEAATTLVECSCGKQFCFQCGGDWHEPVKCSWVKRWKHRIGRDGSSISWIATNTKECPKCGAIIEKAGGCNHMICRKDNCLYEFCWVCMGPWQEHGQNAWYSCNRFNAQSSKLARSHMDSSRSSMLRFLHYYNRYANHQQSLALEKDIHKKIDAKIDEIKTSRGSAWNEMKYLNRSVDTLCKARRVLTYTYIFAYFVKQNNQSLIFEDNQKDLELAAERLSEYLERDIYKTDIDEQKQRVNDYQAYCDQRCRVLVSHIQEGYDNGWWKFDEGRNRM